MQIDSTVRRKFKQTTLRRLSTDLSAICASLRVAEYKASKDFKTEVLQTLGVGYYEPGSSLRVAFGEGGDLTKPLVHNRSCARIS